ncbi:hypothetical protein G6N74_29490 [Mesorhizobium sp. CGMCC 1.15528]|uniref:Uncharacterized protein n=1 Tax=Mesorhizobium zhangyense TaxID=1776730 RepID=A0A7C9VI88_9HYPH|nr:hypothetical protein [Mesorhizobium zhangyense]NGN45190.1 hypothetical protein [Mesorhizobium zhangyense]
MSDTQKVQIAPQAAYVEAQALIEFYRNRNLLLAQQAFELAGTVEAQAAEIERLSTPGDAEKEA